MDPKRFAGIPSDALTEEERHARRDLVLEMYLRGEAYGSIETAIGVPYRTVQSIVRRHLRDKHMDARGSQQAQSDPAKKKRRLKSYRDSISATPHDVPGTSSISRKPRPESFDDLTHFEFAPPAAAAVAAEEPRSPPVSEASVSVDTPSHADMSPRKLVFAEAEDILAASSPAVVKPVPLPISLDGRIEAVPVDDEVVLSIPTLTPISPFVSSPETKLVSPSGTLQRKPTETDRQSAAESVDHRSRDASGLPTVPS